MSAPPIKPKTTTAGIVQDPTSQQRVIPESRRADGSIRKERKVRPGFTPVEDVARFRPSRVREAEQQRQRNVPGSSSAVQASLNRVQASSAVEQSSAKTGTLPGNTVSEAQRVSTPSHTRRPARTAQSLSTKACSMSETIPDTSNTSDQDLKATSKTSWPGSRLRVGRTEIKSTAPIPDVWDDDGEEKRNLDAQDTADQAHKEPEKVAKAADPRTHSKADDALEELAKDVERLRVGKEA